MKPEKNSDEAGRLRDELDQCERDMQRLLDGAVHDLRAAERGIATSAEILAALLSEDGQSAEAEAALSRLRGGKRKLDAILSGMADYSISLPRAHHVFGLVPTESILRSALASLDHEIRETNASVTLGSGGAPLPQVQGEGERLLVLFRNLIDNAIKYRSAAAPRIEIQAKLEGEDWVFSVSDNGIGIDPKYFHELFLPFKRLHGSEIPGAGLGLAVSKKIVATHGGRIWIESEPGKGTTFLFTLPAESDM